MFQDALPLCHFGEMTGVVCILSRVVLVYTTLGPLYGASLGGWLGLVCAVGLWLTKISGFSGYLDLTFVCITKMDGKW